MRSIPRAFIVMLATAIIVAAPVERQLSAQGATAPSPAMAAIPDLSKAPVDVQAIWKKVMSGGVPSAAEAQKLGQWVSRNSAPTVKRPAAGSTQSAGPNSVEAKLAAAAKTCTIVLTGALSGGYGCDTAALLNLTTNATNSGFVVSSSIYMTPVSITAAVQIPGGAHTGTFVGPTAGVTADVRVVSRGGYGGPTFVAQSDTGAAQGTYALTLTSLTPVVSSSTETVYIAHGSLVATLRPAPGNPDLTGIVTLTATF